ncbi:MAG: 4-hydroxyphenylacetate 3-monooxygenase, oxygenase component, partial [Chloroflexi bacterium]|nr:4-hydroxyphenylacetate 3-monooxygenase, oxygenase component [Chloroflexota bacterium]
MPARTGKEYIAGLRDRPREVWIRGELVKDVTSHPYFRNGVQSVAALYDLQHDPEVGHEMTFTSPSTGDQVGLSFMIPRTHEDLERRRNMMARWAWTSCGMMARTPDFLNVGLTAW